MFALVFVHPVKTDGTPCNVSCRSCPANSMAEAISLHQIEKKFRHNVRAWVQRQKKKTGLTSEQILSSDSLFQQFWVRSDLGL